MGFVVNNVWVIHVPAVQKMGQTLLYLLVLTLAEIKDLLLI
jgi:hypothetical protein